jgi:hypothetical protein
MVVVATEDLGAAVVLAILGQRLRILTIPMQMDIGKQDLTLIIIQILEVLMALMDQMATQAMLTHTEVLMGKGDLLSLLLNI